MRTRSSNEKDVKDSIRKLHKHKILLIIPMHACYVILFANHIEHYACSEAASRLYSTGCVSSQRLASCTRAHALRRLIVPTNNPFCELPKSLTIRPNDIIHIRSSFQRNITCLQGTYCRKKANVSLDTASPDLVGPEFPLTK